MGVVSFKVLDASSGNLIDMVADGETSWNGQSEAGHFGEISTFAAQQIAHAGIAFGIFGAKEVDVFLYHMYTDAFSGFG